MGLKFSNFGRAKLATPPSGTGGLSFTVESGKGALFPTLTSGDYCYLVLKNAARTAAEVVKVEGRTGDAFTIATGGRGLDDTSAATWTANDFVEMCVTNIALEEFLALNTAAVQLLATVTPAADKVAYYTGPTAIALADFTSLARTIAAATTQSGVRTAIGAAASGTNTDITSVAVGNSGLTVKDSDASHVLVLRPTSNLTANRNLDIATGDSDRTISLSGNLTVSSAATISGTNTGDQSAASQAEMEAASLTTVFVSPGRQHFHPSAAKAWVLFDGTGSPITPAASYNMDPTTPITDNGTGDYVLNWGTDPSSANVCVIGTCFWQSTVSNADQVVHVGVPVANAWGINTVAGANGTKVDNSRVCVAMFGDI